MLAPFGVDAFNAVRNPCFIATPHSSVRRFRRTRAASDIHGKHPGSPTGELSKKPQTHSWMLPQATFLICLWIKMNVGWHVWLR
jgi:hypothetical protein